MAPADAKYRFLADYFTDVCYGVVTLQGRRGRGQENPVKSLP